MKNLFVITASVAIVLLFAYTAYAAGSPFGQKVAMSAAEGQANNCPIANNADSSEGVGYKYRQMGSGLKDSINHPESGMHMMNNKCSKAE